MDDQELCAPLHGAAKAFHGGIDGESHLADIRGPAGDLQAVQAGVQGRRGGQVQTVVQPPFDLDEGHSFSFRASVAAWPLDFETPVGAD